MSEQHWLLFSRPGTYDWSQHCGKCQATYLACLYEWRNMVWANRYVGLTGIEKWRGL